MKLLASILTLTLLITASAVAATYTAYSLTGVTRTADNTYTATMHIVKTQKPDYTPPFSDGDTVTITTTDCTHVPAKGGEDAMILNGPNDTTSLIFGGARTCTVRHIVK